MRYSIELVVVRSLLGEMQGIDLVESCKEFVRSIQRYSIELSCKEFVRSI